MKGAKGGAGTKQPADADGKDGARASWSLFGRGTKKVKKANLGDESTLYYNSELGRWVERGRENEAATDPSSAPPPVVNGTISTAQSMPRKTVSSRYVLQSNLSVSSSASSLPDTATAAGDSSIPPSRFFVPGAGNASVPGAPKFFVPAPAPQQQHTAPVYSAPLSTTGSDGQSAADEVAASQDLPLHQPTTSADARPANTDIGDAHGGSQHLGAVASSSLSRDSIGVAASLTAAHHTAAMLNNSAAGAEAALLQGPNTGSLPSGARTLDAQHLAGASRGHDKQPFRAAAVTNLPFDQLMHPGSTHKLDGPLPWELPEPLKHSDQFIAICSNWQKQNPGQAYSHELLLASVAGDTPVTGSPMGPAQTSNAAPDHGAAAQAPGLTSNTLQLPSSPQVHMSRQRSAARNQASGHASVNDISDPGMQTSPAASAYMHTAQHMDRAASPPPICNQAQQSLMLQDATSRTMSDSGCHTQGHHATASTAAGHGLQSGVPDAPDLAAISVSLPAVTLECSDPEGGAQQQQQEVEAATGVSLQGSDSGPGVVCTQQEATAAAGTGLKTQEGSLQEQYQQYELAGQWVAWLDAQLPLLHEQHGEDVYNSQAYADWYAQWAHWTAMRQAAEAAIQSASTQQQDEGGIPAPDLATSAITVSTGQADPEQAVASQDTQEHTDHLWTEPLTAPALGNAASGEIAAPSTDQLQQTVSQAAAGPLVSSALQVDQPSPRDHDSVAPFSLMQDQLAQEAVSKLGAAMRVALQQLSQGSGAEQAGMCPASTQGLSSADEAAAATQAEQAPKVQTDPRIVNSTAGSKRCSEDQQDASRGAAAACHNQPPPHSSPPSVSATEAAPGLNTATFVRQLLGRIRQGEQLQSDDLQDVAELMQLLQDPLLTSTAVAHGLIKDRSPLTPAHAPYAPAVSSGAPTRSASPTVPLCNGSLKSPAEPANSTASDPPVTPYDSTPPANGVLNPACALTSPQWPPSAVSVPTAKHLRQPALHYSPEQQEHHTQHMHTNGHAGALDLVAHAEDQMAVLRRELADELDARSLAMQGLLEAKAQELQVAYEVQLQTRLDALRVALHQDYEQQMASMLQQVTEATVKSKAVQEELESTMAALGLEDRKVTALSDLVRDAGLDPTDTLQRIEDDYFAMLEEEEAAAAEQEAEEQVQVQAAGALQSSEQVVAAFARPNSTSAALLIEA